MKVKILGTEYEIIEDAEEKDYPKLKECDGYTDFSIKQIVVSKFEPDEMSVENLVIHSKKVLRHEIVHAFMYESGLDSNSEYARNEELIDWIAIQFEKMLEAFIEVGAISLIGVDINVYDRTSNNPINDPVNPPKVKEAKAFIKDNTDIVNEIGKAINNISPDINKVEIKIPNFIGADYGNGYSKSSYQSGGDG